MPSSTSARRISVDVSSYELMGMALLFFPCNPLRKSSRPAASFLASCSERCCSFTPFLASKSFLASNMSDKSSSIPSISPPTPYITRVWASFRAKSSRCFLKRSCILFLVTGCVKLGFMFARRAAWSKLERVSTCGATWAEAAETSYEIMRSFFEVNFDLRPGLLAAFFALGTLGELQRLELESVPMEALPRLSTTSAMIALSKSRAFRFGAL